MSFSHIQRATIIPMSAPLAGEFGRGLLVNKFGEWEAARILAAFGTYTRGPRKGMQRGYICWSKCTVGGWAHEPRFGSGYVQRPGSFGYIAARNREDTIVVAQRDSFPQMSDNAWDELLVEMCEATTPKARRN